MDLLQGEGGISEDNLLRASPLLVIPEQEFNSDPAAFEANVIGTQEFKVPF
jgi:hypothetical protein